MDAGILVVGAGPAGMAAAWAAATSGARVTLVDDNPEPGGQIWRGGMAKAPGARVRNLFRRIQSSNIRRLKGCQIIDAPEAGLLLAAIGGEPKWIRYEKLVLATGARELFLPFPGWTLPNVYGAGGLQAMVKGGLRVTGKRVVVAGSTPLLLSVAALLRLSGAEVPLVAEQTTLSRLLRFTLSLWHAPRKTVEAAGLVRALIGTGFRTSCYVVRANGNERLNSVTLRQEGREWTVPCDYLAVGYGLTANTELAQLLGCPVEGNRVLVDGMQQTGVPGVYCAGEPTGIGGVEKAEVEGRIAGYAAAGRESEAHALLGERARLHRFADALTRHFALRSELRELPREDTIVCRCEDVRAGEIAAHHSWRSAKLHTRCGMGRCQGRICGPAVEFLYGWPPGSVRPPLFPAPVGALESTAPVSAAVVDPPSGVRKQ